MNRTFLRQLGAFSTGAEFAQWLLPFSATGAGNTYPKTVSASSVTVWGQQPRSGHWSRYVVDDGGHAIDVYLAHDSRPKPLVILIQGSGCAPIMTVESDGSFHDTSLFQDLVTPRLAYLHFALREKRGVAPLRFSTDMTLDQKMAAFERAGRECSPDYLRNATKPLRVSDVFATVRALRRESRVQTVIAAGHSEGTHVATGLIEKADRPEIAAAGLFASADPTPFYGDYLADDARSDPDRLRTVFDRIRMLQRADDDFMYEGLPARRWKTYALDSTPLDDVRNSDVPLFVAQGSRDGSPLRADLFVLEAIRQRPNRPLRCVIVVRGDHVFDTPSGSRLPELFDDFVRWSLDAHRQTGVAQLK